MKNRKTNKLPMEVVLVSKGDQALPTGSFTTTGTNLNLQDGQIGALSWDINSSVRAAGNYIVTGDDSNEVRAIKLVQGTPVSQNTQLADPFEVGDKSHVETGVIKKDAIRSVAVKKAAFATLGAQAMTNFPTIVNNGQYFTYLTLKSTKYYKEYGVNNPNSLYAAAPVTDYTAAGVVNSLDHVLQYIAHSLNMNSKAVSTNTRKGNKSFVVLGLKAGGGTGQALGTITPTTNITFATINGVNQVLKSSVELCQTLARLVQDNAALTNTSTIEVLDITNAGAAAKIDALIVVGLPHSLAAYYDNVEQQMVTPIFNPGGAFISGVDPVITVCNAQEGTGHSRKWSYYLRNRAQLNVHTKQNTPVNDWFSEGVSYVDLAKQFYTSYTIEYFDIESTLTLERVSPKRAIMLFRCEPLSTFVVNVANIVTRIAANNTPVPFVTSNDAGTGTASANVVAGVEAVITAWLEHARTTADEGFSVHGDAIAGGVYLS